MGKQSVYVHSNAEIENFIKENELIIYKGCSLAYWNNTTLRRADWDIVKDTVALKFANGTLNYNPSKNVKYSTFLCTVAKNCAIDEIRRQHPERVQDLDDKGWEQVGDGYESHYATEEKDERLLVKEGVRRLAKEMKDKTKLVLLLRYVLNDEDREALAKEYGVANDFVSLVKTRWLHRLQKHVREVLREDEAGELVLGDDSEIAFLKPYMKW